METASLSSAAGGGIKRKLTFTERLLCASGAAVGGAAMIKAHQVPALMELTLLLGDRP